MVQTNKQIQKAESGLRQFFFFKCHFFCHLKCYSGPDPDDVLDEGVTDRSGNFDLEGSTRELTSIDPVLKIYHDCDDGLIVSKFWNNH